jgi:outer membrane protein
MNRSIKKVVFLVAAFGFLNSAQAQKIAHLSLDSLIRLMPEAKIAGEAAEGFLNGLKQELEAMQTEFQGKYKDYTEKEAGMSDLIKKSKQGDLQQLQTRIQDFQVKAEEEFKRKQIEINTPIYEKAKKGIEAVAKENGYKYVLDTSRERTSVLHSEPSDDILALVKKKLDSMPLITIPGSKAQETGTGTMPAGNKPPVRNGK